MTSSPYAHSQISFFCSFVLLLLAISSPADAFSLSSSPLIRTQTPCTASPRKAPGYILAGCEVSSTNFGHRTNNVGGMSMTEDKSNEGISNSLISTNEDATIYTPFDRPLLAIIDTISLIVFAAIGKSSHNPTDGSLDILAVLVTAFPFVTSWLATSPITGVYSPDSREGNVVLSTCLKVGKGWFIAIPMGIVLRGVIKGYVPPIPFVIVTLVSTLVILAGVRVLFSLAEDFFVEMVN